MTKLKFILVGLFAILTTIPMGAKIATWSVSPKYEQITRYSGDLYVFKENGKWGLIKAGNNVLVPASFDFITTFNNGYALAGKKEGNNFLLERIIGEDGKIITLNETYYLPKSGQYFSEGKMAVVGSNGKYGYINPSGKLVIGCQFDNAFPFKEGWAAVKSGNYAKFIRENYDANPNSNTLIVDFHYGEITNAGNFSGGTAPVAYNKDYALINTTGKKVKKLNEREFIDIFKANSNPPKTGYTGYTTGGSYTEFMQSGKHGLMYGNEEVLAPQFDAFGEKFSDGDIIVTLNGHQGVIRLSEGRIGIETKVDGRNSNEIEIDRKGNAQPITIECDLPSTVGNYRILLDEGNGRYIDRTSQFKLNGNHLTAIITPLIPSNASDANIGIRIEGDGLLLASETKSYTVNYPIRLRVSAPGPKTARANENNIATVSSTISNDSNNEIAVSGQWSTGKVFNVTIPPHSSRTVSTSFTVKNTHAETVRIALSSGESTSSKITFETYF